MIGAFLTSIFWTLSAICGQRAARSLGSLRANIIRLLFAVAFLGILVLALQPGSFHAETFWWLILGGVVGFGIGDVSLYLALARIGSRLTVLITFCVSPLIAAVGEWLVSGVFPTPMEAAAAGLILAGVCLTLRPSSPTHERYGSVTVGLIAAFFAAAGQGCGAVFSRIAIARAAEFELYLPPLSQAFQRVAGGAVFSAIAFGILLTLRKREGAHQPEWRVKNFLWVLGAGLFGPVIGLIFYQWALTTTESWLVLVIISLIPILTIPLAYWLERDRPSPIALIGAGIAVTGLICVTWLRRG